MGRIQKDWQKGTTLTLEGRKRQATSDNHLKKVGGKVAFRKGEVSARKILGKTLKNLITNFR